MRGDRCGWRSSQDTGWQGVGHMTGLLGGQQGVEASQGGAQEAAGAHRTSQCPAPGPSLEGQVSRRPGAGGHRPEEGQAGPQVQELRVKRCSDRSADVLLRNTPTAAGRCSGGGPALGRSIRSGAQGRPQSGGVPGADPEPSLGWAPTQRTAGVRLSQGRGSPTVLRGSGAERGCRGRQARAGRGGWGSGADGGSVSVGAGSADRPVRGPAAPPAGKIPAQRRPQPARGRSAAAPGLWEQYRSSGRAAKRPRTPGTCIPTHSAQAPTAPPGPHALATWALTLEQGVQQVRADAAGAAVMDKEAWARQTCECWPHAPRTRGTRDSVPP